MTSNKQMESGIASPKGTTKACVRQRTRNIRVCKHNRELSLKYIPTETNNAVMLVRNYIPREAMQHAVTRGRPCCHSRGEIVRDSQQIE